MNKNRYIEVIRVRATKEEKANLAVNAKLAGISVSALIRKKIKGIRVVPKVELLLINELRRQGGLLKNNFHTIRNAEFSQDEKIGLLQSQERLLFEMNQLIQKISASHNSR